MTQLNLFEKVQEKKTGKNLDMGESVATCEICSKTLCANDECIDRVVARNVILRKSVEPAQLQRIWYGFRR